MSWFFASLKIRNKDMVMGPHLDIRYLAKSDAIKARRIIQGLLIASKEGIDLAKIHPNTLADKVEKLGSMHFSQ